MKAMNYTLIVTILLVGVMVLLPLVRCLYRTALRSRSVSVMFAMAVAIVAALGFWCALLACCCTW